ncbi:MAG: T9SS type A sorting domain-containing protein [Bacteroidales bacterium]|nr:T9SS type A sorting domain-containing protein [Bacteroidales bacterium]
MRWRFDTGGNSIRYLAVLVAYYRWFLLLCVLITGGYSYSQEPGSKNRIMIFGQLTNRYNGGPVDDHLVQISADTLYNPDFQYFSEVYTDQDGFFLDTVYTLAQKGSLMVSTDDFYGIHYDTTVYFRFIWSGENSLVVNFMIHDSIPPVPYQADFSFFRDPNSTSPLKFKFVDCSNTINIDSWLWNFGDGFFSSEQNPAHEYNHPGVYKVKLTIKGIFSPSGQFMESSITKMVKVTVKNYYHLGGQVFAEYFPIDIGIATLYQITGEGLTMIDTMRFDTLGCFWFYQVIEGDYLVRADLGPGSAMLNHFMATYYGDELFWDQADTIRHHSSYYNYDITLRPCIAYSPGPGEIHGTIVNGDGTLSGITTFPASHVEILLLNSENEPFTGFHSDPEGAFHFMDISLGAYKVHAEVPGKHTEPVPVNLDEAHPTALEVKIIIESSTVQGNVIYGIGELQSGFSSGEVYPNPASGLIRLDVNAEFPDHLRYSILDNGFRVVDSGTLMNSTNPVAVHIDVSGLASGTYLLILTDGTQRLTRKFAVVH